MIEDNNEKLLTFSIGAYNASDLLDSCLESLLAEDILPFLDIIIINDGSTDQTAEVANKYVSAFPSTFRLVNQSNHGIGSTYNVGISLAVGKYFIVLDDDDLIDINELRKFISIIRVVNADLVQYRQKTFGITEKEDPVFGVDCSVIHNIDDCIDKLVLSIHNIAFRTELLKRFNIKADDYYVQCADISYELRAIVFVNSVFFSNLLLYKWRTTHEQGTSISGLAKYADSYLEMAKSALRFWQGLTEKSISPQKGTFIKKIVGQQINSAYYIALISKDTDAVGELNESIKKESTLYSMLSIPARCIRRNVPQINQLFKNLYIFYRKRLRSE